MLNAWPLTKKDVKLLARDRRTIFVLVALPLAFISILGLSTGQLFSQRDKARKVKIVVVNEDQTPLSAKVLDDVYKLQALQVREVPDRKTAKRLLIDGDTDVMVIIGKRYHELVESLDIGDIFFSEQGKLAGRLKNLDIEVQSGQFLANAAEVVEELVFAFAVRTFAPDVLKKRDPTLAMKLLVQAKRASESRGDESPGATAGADETHQGGPTAPARTDWVYQTLVPSYTVMFVFFIVNIMARSFIAERDLETLKRLRIAPISRIGLLIGKTVPFLLISLVQTLLLFVAGKALFGMSWGPEPWMLAPIMLATSLAATALGLVVATTVRTDSQVSAYGNFLVLILAGISGCLMPRSWQPELMQKIGLVTPHAWALIAYDQVLNRDEPDLLLVGKCIGVVTAFAAAFFVIGWSRYRSLE
ncbi:MAG TPA: ABC transporter permease [Planctomycetaceae bacterium]|jgi:ABC-2 type transport system permease protein